MHAYEPLQLVALLNIVGNAEDHGPEASENDRSGV